IMKKRIGDRYDGYRLRNVDTFFLLIPYIMKKRDDSQIFFEDVADADILDAFVRKYQEDIPGLKLYHVFIAALVRLFAIRPRINRFVCGSKIYARNHIAISMSIKRSMTDDGEETNIKPRFAPESTLKDVVDIVNEQVNMNKESGSENDTDKFAKLIGHLPTFIIKTVVNFLMWLDRIGLMPASTIEFSPFHCSGYLTNMGSLGIKSVYHHLYNFGTTSIFLAMGKKEYQYQGSDEGELIKKRILSLKMVVDERICDGYYYASTMRLFSKILQNPEVLLDPPEQVIVDDGISLSKPENIKKE
ncbi:MAG TPA: 2-oxo acid dehydrogenase subunit E2, partial [Clostridia bacterium]|nr:2-oxo acid dehydrogenase subunit E2 [Clostridia bacterium]